MKVLSDEEINKAIKNAQSNFNGIPVLSELLMHTERAIAQAQHLDTLRQVDEMLDGIELFEDIALDICSRTSREVGWDTCHKCCDYDGDDCQSARDDEFPGTIGEEPLCPQDWECAKALAGVIIQTIKNKLEAMKE